MKNLWDLLSYFYEEQRLEMNEINYLIELNGAFQKCRAFVFPLSILTFSKFLEVGLSLKD